MSPARAVSASLLLVAGVCACHPGLRRVTARPPRGESAEVFVYVDPFPPTATRLQLTVDALGAVLADGTAVPLDLIRREVSATADPVLLAWGRLPAGTTRALRLAIRRAVLTGPSGSADLLIPGEAVDVPLVAALAPGAAGVFSVGLGAQGDLTTAVQLSTSLQARRVDSPMPELLSYVSAPDAAMVLAVDRRHGRVADAIATGRGPRGVAIDRVQRRAYVALSQDDAIAVIDLAAGREHQRIHGYPGDEPVEVEWVASRGVLLVVNAGSNAVSFVRPELEAEVARVTTGERPVSVVVDREARRAYVLNELAGSLTVLDLANMAVVATVRTEPRPIRAQLDRLGRELTVLAAGSPELVVYELPTLRAVRRIYVGLGARGLRLDPATGNLWVASGDDPKLVMFAPHALLPSVSVPLPGNASYLVIDDVENRLWAALPEHRAVAVIDLVSRRIEHVAELGAEPSYLTLVSERR